MRNAIAEKINKALLLLFTREMATEYSLRLIARVLTYDGVKP